METNHPETEEPVSDETLLALSEEIIAEYRTVYEELAK